MPDEPAKVLDTEIRAHHPDSPSSLQASEACPLFENEQRDSKASKDGTLQHKAAEVRDRTLLDGNPEWERAYEDVTSYADNCIAFHAREYGAPPKVLKETYLGVGDETLEKFKGVTGGFPDEIILSPLRADILDWKFGKIPVVKTKDNIQGKSYMVALLQAVPTLPGVWVHFRAPHQGWSEQAFQEYYVHYFPRDEIVEHELKIRTIIARKRAAVARLHKTGSYADATPKMDLCIWCARKGDCKKVHSLMIQGAEKYPNFIIPETTNPLQLSRPAQYAQAFRWAVQVENIAKEIKRRCGIAVTTENLEFEEGDSIKLVKRTERQIKSVRELVRAALRAGLKMRDLIPLMGIPITAVEEKIKALAVKGKGAAAVRAFQMDLLESGAVEMGQPIYFLQEVKAPKEKDKSILELNT